MSGRIAKSQIPVLSQSALPAEAKFALINAKNAVRAGGRFEIFANERGRDFDGPPLPRVTQGCVYYEVRVGQARPEDPQGAGGVKRLVLEVNTSSRQILEVYYTQEHYAKFTFVRLI